MTNNRIIIITNFILLIIPQYIEVVFATPDDYFMALFVSGNYSGSPSPYMVFTNYIYGKALSFLYTYFHGLEWYSVIQYILGVISFNVIQYYLLSAKININSKYLLLSVLFVVQLCILISPNFTITAAELSLTSIILLTHSHYIYSLFFFIVAFLIRSSAAFIPYMIISPLIVTQLKYKTIDYKKTIGTILLIAISSYTLNIINQYKYNENEKWKNYKEYNTYRGFINDNPSYSDVDISLLHSQNKMMEYELLTKYWISDGNILNNSDMRQIASFLNEKRINNIKKNLKPILNHYGFIGLVIILLTIYLLYRLFREGFVLDALTIVISFSLFILANMYMMNRSFIKERVIICFFFSLIYVICHIYIKHIKQLVPLCVCLLLIFISYSSKFSTLIYQNSASVLSTRKVEKLISDCSSQKIVFHSNVAMSMNIFHLSDNIISQKVLRVGWPNKTPLTLKYYKGYMSHVNGIPFIASKKHIQNELSLMTGILSSYYHQNVIIDTLIEDKDNIVISLNAK